MFTVSLNAEILYFAYGMNTNRQGMAQRCPAARPVGPAQLLAHRFRFAGPADVQIDRRHSVHGVLWNITEQCLTSLDLLEGYPDFYDRKWALVSWQGQTLQALVYFMQPGHANRSPSIHYFDTVYQGYRDFGVPTDQLYKSVTKSSTFQPWPL